MRPDILRARTGARYLLIAAICAAAATACGSTSAPAGAAGPASPAPPKVSLDIRVSGGGPGKPTEHWTLQCDPAGGTHPDPAKACATLLKAKTPFAPVSKRVACPMILASSKTAKVTGTYFGQHVDATFVQGGCDLARWARIGQIFN